MKSSLPIVALSSLLCACSINLGKPLTQDIYDRDLTRTYNGSKQECFNATKSALKDFEFTIEKEDLDKGKLITNKKNTVEQLIRESIAGGNKKYDDVNVAYKYYFSVNEALEGKCIVKVDRFRGWYLGKEVTEFGIDYLKEHQWNPILNEIEEKLNNDF